MEEIIKISNNRLSLTITNYGGRVMSWEVDGVDIVLGFETIEEYKSANEPYHSALIGRYANRVANARFKLKEKTYELDQNHGQHILHGGSSAFHNSMWTIISKSDTHVELEFISADGDQGFPGELKSIARYEIDDNALKLEIKSTTTKSTPVSITHHPYFNLSGLNSKDLEQHEFLIHSDQVLSTNKEGIPDGNKLGVGYTGFDFTKWKKLSKAMQESHSQIELLGGIDHTYIMDVDSKLRLQAEAKSIDSNVHMQVYSNQPGVQFYTANHFDGNEKGKQGRTHAHRSAFCFEPQRWPDSPNHDNFPNSMLHPNEEFTFSMEYRFL